MRLVASTEKCRLVHPSADEWGGFNNWGFMTERQKQVVRLTARGLTEKEISKELGCSLRTVQYDKQRVAVKHNITARQVRYYAAAGKIET